MATNLTDDEMNRLRNEVERAVGHKITTPKDFNMLGQRIEARLGKTISAMTLMRVWNYVKSDSAPSPFTLTLLTRFLGYSGMAEFLESTNPEADEVSTTVLSRSIDVKEELLAGDRLLLTWKPDRECEVMYLGGERFKVIKSKKTKLKAGNTFACGLIIEDEPLYLTDLIIGNMPPVNYVCGMNGGVRFELLVINTPDPT